ncbi:MAG: GlsB/YeaQ/YmgE family stress response membrane protein [Pseudanabaena sp.]|nr:MAG: GlsB/YeaQ/YmgE family stress response membrane protein [Pseudanabaena sp.]
MNFVWFILIGMAAGWIAGQLVKGSSFGLLGNIIVGVIGALLGGFLFSTFGVATGSGLLGSLIVATIGAVVLLLGLRLIKSA